VRSSIPHSWCSQPDPWRGFCLALYTGLYLWQKIFQLNKEMTAKILNALVFTVCTGWGQSELLAPTYNSFSKKALL
jgi:hypothetical protein